MSAHGGRPMTLDEIAAAERGMPSRKHVNAQDRIAAALKLLDECHERRETMVRCAEIRRVLAGLPVDHVTNNAHAEGGR